MAKTTKMDRRLRIAGTLAVLGLLIELGSLQWSHPLAFIVFVTVGELLIAAGILVYLYSLVSGADSVARKNSEMRPICEP